MLYFRIILWFLVVLYPLGMVGQNARHAAMSTSTVMIYDAWSVMDNQAGIASENSPVILAGYENRFQLKETSTQIAAFILPTKTGNFALNYNRYGYQLYSENQLGLAYSRNLGRFISVGIQFDYLYIHQTEDYGNKGVFLIETGIIAQPTDKFFIGVHLFNPTRTKIADYYDERITTCFRFGLGYRLSDKVMATLEAEKDMENPTRFKAAIEYEPLKHLFLRTGVQSNPNQFSLGIGYTFKNLTTDIAFVTHESLPLSSQLSLKYIFNN